MSRVIHIKEKWRSLQAALFFIKTIIAYVPVAINAKVIWPRITTNVTVGFSLAIFRRFLKSVLRMKRRKDATKPWTPIRRFTALGIATAGSSAAFRCLTRWRVSWTSAFAALYCLAPLRVATADAATAFRSFTTFSISKNRGVCEVEVEMLMLSYHVRVYKFENIYRKKIRHSL